LGWLFLIIVAVLVLVGVGLGLVSLPDARRYLKLRRM